MAVQYGVNILSSDMRNILEKNDRQQNGVRTWRQLFGNASLGYENQADSLKSYYSDAMAQAYKSNLAQQNNIMGAGLNVGATNELVSLNRRNLQDTYNNYIKNYSNNLQTAATAYGKEIDAISQGLTERADNFSKLYNSAYTYLSEELAGSVDAQAKNYLDLNNMGWMYEGEGADRKIAPWNKLAERFKNVDGTISEEGTKFFDQLFNARPEGFSREDEKEGKKNTRSFDAWLSEKDGELRDWLSSQDLFNYNFAGTNLGTANVITKRESRDDSTSNYEYVNTSGMAELQNLAFNESAALDTSNKAVLAKTDYADRLAYDNEVIGYGPGGGKVTRAQKYSIRDPDMYKALYLENTYKAADEKAIGEWQSYKKSVEEQYSKLDALFKSKVTGDLYSKFSAENKALLDEYNSVVEKMRQSKYANSYLINHYKRIYNSIYNEMNNLLIQGMNTKKISGL